jgi:hypothetical protein
MSVLKKGNAALCGEPDKSNPRFAEHPRSGILEEWSAASIIPASAVPASVAPTELRSMRLVGTTNCPFLYWQTINGYVPVGYVERIWRVDHELRFTARMCDAKLCLECGSLANLRGRLAYRSTRQTAGGIATFALAAA